MKNKNKNNYNLRRKRNLLNICLKFGINLLFVYYVTEKEGEEGLGGQFQESKLIF